jgi:prophage antirepressor-like protein
MTQKQALQIFEERKVRTVWDDEQEKWYFSVIDVVEVLTDSINPTDYFKKMRKREPELSAFVGTNCPQVEMLTNTGKKRKTLAADTEQLFRIIQSIPSPKAEPFKLWMAQVASTRIDQMQDPELSIEQAMLDYKRLGYSDNWINQRLKSIEVRKELTDEWKRRGVEEGVQFATLTDIITQTWSGKTTKEYKQFKGLKKENLRDNMTNTELILNMLAESATTDLSKEQKPETFDENMNVAHKGGKVARSARMELEKQLGHSVVTPLNAKKYLNQIGEIGEADSNK